MTPKPTYEELEARVRALEADLHRQRHQVAEIDHSRELIMALIDSLPLNVFGKDRKGRFVFANAAFCRTLEKPLEAVLGCTDFDLHPEVLAHKYRQDDLAVMQTGETRMIEEKHKLSGADHLHVNVVKAPLKLPNQETGGVIGIFWDITRRKQAEAALQASEKRFRDLVNLLPQSIFETNADSRLVFVNQSAQKIFGYPPEDLAQGMDLYAFISPEDHDRLRSDFRKTLAKRSPAGREYVARCADGRTFPIAMYMSPILTASETVGVRGIAIDLSDVHQLEERLSIAQKMEAVGLLAGGVAHDLNNLLGPILGYAELLMLEMSSGDPNRPSIQSIHKAGARARDMVHQLLAFARKQPLKMKTLDLNQVIIRFEKLLRRTIREDIRITLTLAPTPLPVEADAGQLEQVLMNLAVNAQDAMPDGGLLQIGTALHDPRDGRGNPRPQRKEDARVILTLSDTGHGITPADREKIFDPFFSTKTKGKGTGLGLSTVYGIVRQHRGSIQVESEPGQGTTFQLFFPAAADMRIATDQADESRPPRQMPISSTIMVVEDEAMVRDLAVNILERQGYRVLSAESGADCLQRLRGHSGPLDLLLTDVIMPGMNGRDLYRAVLGPFPQVNVLYMSGYTDNVILHHGVLEEGIHFIQKPFSVDGLIAKVGQILEAD